MTSPLNDPEPTPEEYLVHAEHFASLPESQQYIDFIGIPAELMVTMTVTVGLAINEAVTSDCDCSVCDSLRTMAKSSLGA